MFDHVTHQEWLWKQLMPTTNDIAFCVVFQPETMKYVILISPCMPQMITKWNLQGEEKTFLYNDHYTEYFQSVMETNVTV